MASDPDVVDTLARMQPHSFAQTVRDAARIRAHFVATAHTATPALRLMHENLLRLAHAAGRLLR